MYRRVKYKTWWHICRSEPFGGAGHSKEIVKKLSKKGLLIGIDRDFEALKAAKENLKK